MNNKRIIKLIAIALALIMLLSLVASVIPIIANADGEELLQKIEELQSQREELKNERISAEEKLSALREQQAALIEIKCALEERNNAAAEEIALINEQIAALEEEIASLDEEIASFAEMIRLKALEVDAAKALEDEQLQRYRVRVRAMEESGGYNIIDLLVRSSSLSDLLTSIEDMGLIMKQDKELEAKYIEAREAHEAVKAEYEAEKAELEAKQLELEAQQLELEASREEFETEKAVIEANIAESEATLSEISEDIQKAEEERRAAEAAEAAAAADILSFINQYNQQKAEEEANRNKPQTQPQPESGSEGSTEGGGESSEPGGETGGESGGETGGETSSPESPAEPPAQTPTEEYIPVGPVVTGTYAWPVPSSYRVTSTYKIRDGRQHTGIDIDGYGLDGYSIVASDGGTVIKAEYYGGYGNCVVIDHGGNRQTLYAHLSGYAVSYGDQVSQGQCIGYLGSTGNSTGTHCHFEIILNGSRVDPLPYLSGYYLWPGADD